MPEVTFVDHDVWFSGLAGVVVAAGAVITDPQDRVLLVKPNYRDLWSVPGGICEFGEPPKDGCEREVAEEIGLTIASGRLLVVDWSQPFGADARPIMHMLFDGGELDNGDGIVLQAAELDEFRFTAVAEFPEYLPKHGLDRVSAALLARRSGTAGYLQHPPR